MPEFERTSVSDPRAVILLDEYFTSRERGFVGGRYRVTPPEPTHFLPPTGLFLLVIDDNHHAQGCGGIRSLGGSRFEIKHLFLRSTTRGKGWGRLLLEELEASARDLGGTTVVLDTNSSLRAAGTLYQRAGYTPIEPYNANPNADTWLKKTLGSHVGGKATD